MSRGQHAAGQAETSWNRLVSKSLPAIVWSTDAQLRIVTYAGAWLEERGARQGSLVGTTLFELFETRDPESPPIIAHRRALNGEAGPLVFSLADQTFGGTVVPLRSENAIIGCTAAVVPERPFDARCQSIADAAVERILFLTPEGVIENVNRTAKRATREQVIGRTIYEFVPPDHHKQLRQAIQSVLDTGRVSAFEVRFVGRLERESWQAMRIGPIRQDQRITGLVLLATDITQPKLSMRKLEAEEELLRHLLELQDRERRMVAYEIHDGFIQDVIGARMLLQGIQESFARNDSSVPETIEHAISLLGRAVNDGRRLISELRPMIIDEMGIIEAVEYLVSEEESRGDVEIEFTHRVQFERLPPLLQATLFRIIREALTNARRHGRAGHIEIRLTQIGNQQVILEIQDDGCGFDPDRVASDRFGLAGIRDRAKLFGGGATIESAPGRGTRITVKVSLDAPLEAADNNRAGWKWTV